METQPPSTIPVNPTFVDFLCFQLDPAFRRLNPEPKKQAIQQFSEALSLKRPEVSHRLYLSMALRHDTDFFLWAIAQDLAPLQQLGADLLKTGLGGFLKLSYTFVAMTRPSVYNPMHIPAFSATEQGVHHSSSADVRQGRVADGSASSSGGEQGEGPRRYLFLYPFVKSREWYLLPFEKRRDIMRGHMAIGEIYPMVRLNTTYSFGLGDQDFVLAFETDQPAAFEDLVQRLRETEASRYTVRDTPFILGQWCQGAHQLLTGLGL